MSKYRYKLAETLVWLANRLVKNRNVPTYWPLYRPVDQVAPDEKYACGAYSLEGLRSIVQQYKDDGLEQLTVEWLISDDGWEEINSPEMAQEVADTLNKEATFLATKHEQEELNKL